MLAVYLKAWLGLRGAHLGLAISVLGVMGQQAVPQSHSHPPSIQLSNINAKKISNLQQHLQKQP